MVKWSIRENKDFFADKESMALAMDIHPVIARLLHSRGVALPEQKAFLDPDYEKSCHDPLLLKGMEEALDRIALAKSRGEKVAIFGDYDADGITSSIIVREALAALDLEAEVYIPDKKTEGYGLNVAAVENLCQDGNKLIITVDCGITAHKEVARAKELGTDVIVTDHHHVPEELVDALAVINPHRKDCAYPCKDLAGVGVAFKLVQAIYARFLPEKIGETKWMLDLVAIGTIADCVPLKGENRTLARFGLLVLSKTKRVGLKEMFAVGKIAVEEGVIPESRAVSFHVAPRINAAGRVDHANLAYDLLVSQDRVHARSLALELEAQNSQRQRMTEAAVNQVRAKAEGEKRELPFIWAADESFPIGIVGLVAGKIAQQYNLPTMVLSRSEKESKGSLRSIEAVNIMEAIEKCAHLLERFGGHAQAAGLTVANDKLPQLCVALGEAIKKELEGKETDPVLMLDAEIEAKEIDALLARQLAELKPFGQGNEEPLFLIKNMRIAASRVVGNGTKHLKMAVAPADGSAPMLLDSIWFGAGEKAFEFKEGEVIDLAVKVRLDSWNGNEKIQLLVEDARKTYSM